jgi:hypothetical protein
MVRRWSYLNLVNSARVVDLSAHYVLKLPTFFEALFKATTYYYQPLFSENLSKLVRRSFARLRHITNLLVYQNLLVNWSQEYLSLRKLFRFALSIRLYKYNYFTGTSSQSFTKDELTFFSYTQFSVWTLRGISLRSMRSTLSPLLGFFRQSPHLHTLVVSSLTQLKTREDVSYCDVGALTDPNPKSLHLLPLYMQVTNLAFQLYLLSLLPIYRVFIYALMLR